jgi:hypothetical protein
MTFLLDWPESNEMVNVFGAMQSTWVGIFYKRNQGIEIKR